MEAARWLARESGDEHRDHGMALDVAQGHPGLEQRVLDGQAAAQEKRDEILPPEVTDAAAPASV